MRRGACLILAVILALGLAATEAPAAPTAPVTPEAPAFVGTEALMLPAVAGNVFCDGFAREVPGGGYFPADGPFGIMASIAYVPTGVGWNSNSFVIVGRGIDNAVWVTVLRMDTNEWASYWWYMGGQTYAHPAISAGTWGPYSYEDLWVLGTDWRVWLDQDVNFGWSDWQPIEGANLPKPTTWAKSNRAARSVQLEKGPPHPAGGFRLYYRCWN